jgi:hypothetical protein
MATQKDNQNYVLGRGEFHFAKFEPGTRVGKHYVYFGNTPELNITVEIEMLDHYDSDHGIREKDDSMTLQVNRTGSLITDNIKVHNIALFYFGTVNLVTTAAAADVEESIVGVVPDASYQLGVTPSNPMGLGGLDPADITVEVGASVKVVDVDYKIYARTGMIKILSTGTIAAGATVDVTYTVKASTKNRVISGSQPVEGCVKYITFNPKGPQQDYFMPYVKLTPNGDYALKGDEWQSIPFTLDIQKLGNLEAVYVDDEPLFTV